MKDAGRRYDKARQGAARIELIFAVALIIGLAVFFVLSTWHYHKISGTYLNGAVHLYYEIVNGHHSDQGYVIWHRFENKTYYPPLYWLVTDAAVRTGLGDRRVLYTLWSLAVVLAAALIGFCPGLRKEQRRLGLAGVLVYLGWSGVFGLSKFLTLDGFFLLLGPPVILLFGLWLRRPSFLLALAGGLLMGLGLLAKWSFGIFFVAPLFAFWLGSDKKIRSAIGLVVGAFLVCGWWYLLHLDWSNFLSSMPHQAWTGGFIEIVWWYLRTLVVSLLGPVGCLLIAGGLVLARNEKRLAQAAVWLLGSVGVPILLLSAFKNAESRYLAGIFAPLTLWTVDAWRPALIHRRRWLLVSLLALAVFGQSIYVAYGDRCKPMGHEGYVLESPFRGAKLAHLGTTTQPLKEALAKSPANDPIIKRPLVFLEVCLDDVSFIDLAARLDWLQNKSDWPTVGEVFLFKDRAEVLPLIKAGRAPWLVVHEECVGFEQKDQKALIDPTKEIISLPEGDFYRDPISGNLIPAYRQVDPVWRELDRYYEAGETFTAGESFRLYRPRLDSMPQEMDHER